MNEVYLLAISYFICGFCLSVLLVDTIYKRNSAHTRIDSGCLLMLEYV